MSARYLGGKRMFEDLSYIEVQRLKSEYSNLEMSNTTIVIVDGREDGVERVMDERTIE